MVPLKSKNLPKKKKLPPKNPPSQYQTIVGLNPAGPKQKPPQPSSSKNQKTPPSGKLSHQKTKNNFNKNPLPPQINLLLKIPPKCSQTYSPKKLPPPICPPEYPTIKSTKIASNTSKYIYTLYMPFTPLYLFS